MLLMTDDSGRDTMCSVVSAMVSTVVLFAASIAACAAAPWMGASFEDISNRTLRQVTLPGTHDSGAYNLTTVLQPGDSAGPLFDALIEAAEKLGVPINDIITPFALAQDQDLFGQLEGGIRYIDFRAGWDGTTWHTFHFEVGTPSSVLLADVARFLNGPGNEKEVIVLEVNGMGGGNETTAAIDELITMINSTFPIGTDTVSGPCPTRFEPMSLPPSHSVIVTYAIWRCVLWQAHWACSCCPTTPATRCRLLERWSRRASARW